MHQLISQQKRQCGLKTKKRDTMKKLTYILFATVLVLTGCDTDFDSAEQGFGFEFLPGLYVAFDAPGSTNTLAPFEVGEADGEVEVTVEIPTGTLSDVSINYAFSGTAVFGTDFTVAGATAAGGTIILTPKPGDDPENIAENVDIIVTLLTDNVGDGEKTLNIELTSASNTEGNVAVGVGGTDSLTTATVIISDNDYIVFADEAVTAQENEGTVSLEIEAYPGATRTTDITVNYSLSGTAVYGVDYTIAGATATGGTVTIPAPTTAPEEDDPVTFELDVQLLTDSVADGEKTIIVSLDSADDGSPISVGVGGTATGQTSTITINDAANSVAFSVASQSVDVDEIDGTTNITFELHAGDDPLTDVTVDYSLGGTAVFGVDYTITGATADGGSVVITPNSPPGGAPTTLDLQIQLLTDDVSDGDKTIVVTIDSATLTDATELSVGVDGAGATSTITIADSDFVSFEENSLEVDVDENAGSTSVTLEALTTVDINVNYSLGGTAVYGVDYTITGATSAGGSATINPGSPGVTNLDIQILTDTAEDGDKTIVITLVDASQADGTPFTIKAGTSTVTIADVD